ncbi:MAG: LysR substrate-binding domain-containing protein [Minicystis sp.]
MLSWTAPGENGTRWPLQAGGWLSVDSTVCSSDIETVRGLATAGLGIALVPDPDEIRPLINHGDVVRVLPDVVGTDLSVWMLMPTARVGARRTRAIVEITKEIRAWVAQRSPDPH